MFRAATVIYLQMKLESIDYETNKRLVLNMYASVHLKKKRKDLAFNVKVCDKVILYTYVLLENF